MQEYEKRIKSLEESVASLESTIARLMQFISIEENNLTIGNKAKQIVLQAEKISIDAVGDISVTTEADVKTYGLNIENNANVCFTAKGNTSAELSAAGTTTVKGAMVMIN